MLTLLTVIKTIWDFLVSVKDWLNNHLTLRHYLFLLSLVLGGFIYGRCAGAGNKFVVRNGSNGAETPGTGSPNVPGETKLRKLERAIVTDNHGPNVASVLIPGTVYPDAQSGRDGDNKPSAVCGPGGGIQAGSDSFYSYSGSYHGRTNQIGIEAILPKGLGIDYQFYQFHDFETHFGAAYFFDEKKATPSFGIGYNPWRVTKVTHNTYLFMSWGPLGPSNLGTFFGGIRINL